MKTSAVKQAKKVAWISWRQICSEGSCEMIDIAKVLGAHARPATRLRCCVLGILCVALTGCVSLENEEGRLPDAMRSAINSLTAKGYPDLTKIPDAPTNLPNAATWTALETGLVGQGSRLNNNTDARAPTPDETNLDWAQKERAALDADPRAQPLPAPVAGAAESPDWAAAARAKLEADLARLPPL